ncbi:MAG: ABC transporter ATP-binding protein [Nitrosarchaeum sp.]|nr:ABC transporter ATP-binding protein [Nitrosarchaeum sp.]
MFEDNVLFTNTNAPDVIELKNICQTYDSGKAYVIKDLNLLIEDKTDTGKFIVILGASGCGKSTVLRYISGLQPPTSGEVLVNGKPIGKRTKVGMVFQQYSSFPWLSVLDNVALGLEYKGVSKKDRHEKAMEMIKLTGLEGQEKKFAKYPTLSGGQLQRVAIARSLIAAPEILLMDEPFGALDIHTRLKMQDLLCSIWTKIHTTVVFVTHDISESVYLGDEIFIMRSNPGKIVEKIDINLPLVRTRELKRERLFLDLVYKVEDSLTTVQNHMDEEKAKK